MSKSSLKDSKLYAMAQTNTMFSGLIPNIGTKMAIEAVLTDQHPREEGDDSIRIFCQYIDSDGQNMTAMVTSTDTTETSVFDIDAFLAGYLNGLEDMELPTDPIDQIEFVAREAATYAWCVILGLEEDNAHLDGTKQVASNFISAFMLTVYGDPLDVFVIITEVKDEETNMSDHLIRSMWIVKARSECDMTIEAV